jgi:hypothetical protein
MDHKIADSALAISGTTALISIASVQTAIQMAAGLTAIFSGLFASRYYYLKSKK